MSEKPHSIGLPVRLPARATRLLHRKRKPQPLDPTESAMMYKEDIYGYSSLTRPRPDLRITLEPGTNDPVKVTCRRIHGNGDPPVYVWLSGVDHLLYTAAYSRIAAPWARTHPKSWEAQAVEMMDMGDYWMKATEMYGDTGWCWVRPAGRLATNSRVTHQTPLRRDNRARKRSTN
jgi:hypothetical protein